MLFEEISQFRFIERITGLFTYQQIRICSFQNWQYFPALCVSLEATIVLVLHEYHHASGGAYYPGDLIDTLDNTICVVTWWVSFEQSYLHVDNY